MPRNVARRAQEEAGQGVGKGLVKTGSFRRPKVRRIKQLTDEW